MEKYSKNFVLDLSLLNTKQDLRYLGAGRIECYYRISKMWFEDPLKEYNLVR